MMYRTTIELTYRGIIPLDQVPGNSNSEVAEIDVQSVAYDVYTSHQFVHWKTNQQP
jgi:hypothetical protein